MGCSVINQPAIGYPMTLETPMTLNQSMGSSDVDHLRKDRAAAQAIPPIAHVQNIFNQLGLAKNEKNGTRPADDDDDYDDDDDDDDDADDDDDEEEEDDDDDEEEEDEDDDHDHDHDHNHLQHDHDHDHNHLQHGSHKYYAIATTVAGCSF